MADKTTLGMVFLLFIVMRMRVFFAVELSVMV